MAHTVITDADHHPSCKVADLATVAPGHYTTSVRTANPVFDKRIKRSDDVRSYEEFPAGTRVRIIHYSREAEIFVSFGAVQSGRSHCSGRGVRLFLGHGNHPAPQNALWQVVMALVPIVTTETQVADIMGGRSGSEVSGDDAMLVMLVDDGYLTLKGLAVTAEKYHAKVEADYQAEQAAKAAARSERKAQG